MDCTCTTAEKDLSSGFSPLFFMSSKTSRALCAFPFLAQDSISVLKVTTVGMTCAWSMSFSTLRALSSQKQ